MSTSLDENSSVKVVLVLAGVPFLVAGIFWLANLSDKAAANDAEVKGLRAIVTELRDHSIETERDIKWIKEKMGRK
jgi:hypothetical protein